MPAIPTPEALAKADEIVAACEHAGAPAFEGDGWGACVPCVAQALTEQARAIERSTWEAAAKEAEQRESPWSTEHPKEAFINTLQGVVLDAMVSAPRDDDNEPEHSVALAVFEFLSTGQTKIDKLFGVLPLSSVLRARAAVQGG